MSIIHEINSDPTLRRFMMWEIDYAHFNHQVELKFTAIRIVLNRKLKKQTQ